MPSIKSIKQRIKSVKSTSQITKAMEVVSATKMRHSQEFALRARPYAVASLEMMQNLLARTPELPPLLQTREVKNSLLLVITSDKGLAGAFNANILRIAETRTHAESTQIHGEKSQRSSASSPRKSAFIVTVGKKAKEYFERRGIPIEKSFSGYGDYSSLEETSVIAEIILKGFLEGQWDEVEAVYTNFRTTLLQESVLKKILPATKEGLEDAVRSILPEYGRFALQARTYADGTRTHAEKSQRKSAFNYEYKFEPSSEEILNALVPQLIKMHIHHIILESNASEHSARMVAMKNASDNAKDLISGLTIAYNKARQANITRELTEITAGSEALET